MRTPPRGSIGALSAEEQNLLLDLSQIALDLVGFADPTPVSDGANALISAGRGDWFGAGISAVAMLPLLGDLAKAGKLGRWAQTVEKTVALMRRNAALAERARPVLQQIRKLLEQMPVAMLPREVQPAMERMRGSIDSILGSSSRLMRRQWLQSYWREWDRYIDTIALPSVGPGRGVLWSRLPDGAEHAKSIARSDGHVTLEMQLAPLKFEERYRVAQLKLTELLGNTKDVKDEIWEHFGRKVWEKISRRYAEGLSGRVRAHVRFSGAHGLDQLVTNADKGVRAGHEAIIWDELDQIGDWMMLNARITSVELIDIYTGKTKIMTRDDVLRAARKWQ
jgi:hypothetical protein